MRRPVLAACLVLAALAAHSCDDFLEPDAPNSQLNSGNVFETRATATAAMTGIYARMRDTGLLTGSTNGLSNLLGMYGDEMDFYGAAETDASLFYQNSVLPSTATVRSLWNAAYNQVYAANAMLAGLEGADALSEADRSQLMGEALFARALLHFYLANVWGDVPYVTTTDYERNTHVARLPLAQVYERCAADLDEAAALLPEAYVNAGRTRPNAFAARALLARVSLYAGDYNRAAGEASAVLGHTALYTMPAGPAAAFLKTSPATVWQFSPGSQNSNTYEAATFIFNSGPPARSALSTSLMAAFPPGDLRRTHWTRAVTAGANTWYHAYKYKAAATAPATENSIVLRLGELYLVRAEARARAGELTGARDDLNVIRAAAGIGDTPAVSQEEVLADILLQRRLELFAEFGHRFFDLRRFGQLQATMGAAKPGWDTRDALLPLPERELQLNPALAPQNPGY